MSTDWTYGAGEEGSKRGGFLGTVRAYGWISGTGARRQKGGRHCKLHVIFVGVRGRQHS